MYKAIGQKKGTSTCRDWRELMVWRRRGAGGGEARVQGALEDGEATGLARDEMGVV
jgi:hypothetical protein